MTRPLFLCVNLMDTHLPYGFDAAAIAAVRGLDVVEGARVAAHAVSERTALAHLYGIRHLDAVLLQGLQAAYDGAVRTDDAATGSILDALREDRQLEGALIAVTADHGESLGEHGEMSHLLTLHEQVLRVPLVVSWPGRLERGRVENSQVRLQDLYPTILEAAGQPVPPQCGLDAITLTEKPLSRRVAVAEYVAPHEHLDETIAVFPGHPAKLWERFFHSLVSVQEETISGRRIKYIATRRFNPADRTELLIEEEMFDLSSDPEEKRNLLGKGLFPEDRVLGNRLRSLGEPEASFVR